MTYVDETTFEETQVLVDDLQFEIGRAVQNALAKLSVEPNGEDLYVSIMPLIAKKNGDLVTGYLTRRNRDIDSDKYRIIIEKIV